MYSHPSQLLTYWLTIGFPTFVAVIVPALLALAAGIYARHYFKDRRVQIAIVGLIVINTLFTVPQFVFQLAHGTHLLPAYIAVMIYLYRQKGFHTCAPAAFTATWLTIFIPDVISVFGHHVVLHDDPAHIWTALAWVGGAGAYDGLIWFPLVTAALAPIVPKAVDALRNLGGRSLEMPVWFQIIKS